MLFRYYNNFIQRNNAYLKNRGVCQVRPGYRYIDISLMSMSILSDVVVEICYVVTVSVFYASNGQLSKESSESLLMIFVTFKINSVGST